MVIICWCWRGGTDWILLYRQIERSACTRVCRELAVGVCAVVWVCSPLVSTAPVVQLLMCICVTRPALVRWAGRERPSMLCWGVRSWYSVASGSFIPRAGQTSQRGVRCEAALEQRSRIRSGAYSVLRCVGVVSKGCGRVGRSDFRPIGDVDVLTCFGNKCFGLLA